jgi:endonuclease YncB( thermonuclease family)
VTRVVDGDTIVVRLLGGVLGSTATGEGEEVRLIGIDAPEAGEDFSQEALGPVRPGVIGVDLLDAETGSHGRSATSS